MSDSQVHTSGAVQIDPLTMMYSHLHVNVNVR